MSCTPCHEATAEILPGPRCQRAGRAKAAPQQEERKRVQERAIREQEQRKRRLLEALQGPKMAGLLRHELTHLICLLGPLTVLGITGGAGRLL